MSNGEFCPKCRKYYGKDDWCCKCQPENELIGHMSSEQCPKCGCSLLVNKRGDKWCSFIGGVSIPACDYGLK